MLPVEFKDRFKKLLTEVEYTEFIEAFETDDKRVYALRINHLKADNLEMFKEKVPWEEDGRYYGDDLFPGKHPYHEAGVYYIQEPSAMAPVHFLDPKPGDKVLDLCAAPGGKTTQIGAKLGGKGLLFTNEINRDRCRILSLNIERLGVVNAVVLNEDSGHLSEIFEGYFDKILVDAPCSGEGMFRKNEEALLEWSLENVFLCAKRQSEILDNAAKMLAPGGRMVYSTCTFSPEENENNIYDFLLRHDDFYVEKIKPFGGMEKGRKEWVDTSENVRDDILDQVSGSIRLWPHKVRGEGHFLCVLRRKGTGSFEGSGNYVPGGRFIRAGKDVIKPIETFLSDTLSESSKYIIDHKNSTMSLNLSKGRNISGAFLSFGDQIYLAPEDMPSIKGLKALRPGLHLGTIKKDRFEPSHALALVLLENDVKLYIDYLSDSEEIKQFLNGQSIRLKSDETDSHIKMLKDKKGWCLVGTDSYSIGWAKLAGGMLKNHYPKGLRINY